MTSEVEQVYICLTIVLDAFSQEYKMRKKYIISTGQNSSVEAFR